MGPHPSVTTAPASVERKNMEATGAETLRALAELLERQEFEAERDAMVCLAGHVAWSVPRRACPECGLTLISPQHAAYFDAICLGGVERRRK